ncbi:MAG: selenocysteine-specific translation elongation factor [Sterolibacteriaceae bacterium]|uniref:selenocysteine-specific translation elongation factor n=1 Tax=Sulfuritalea sp. TaxID=2480090 RepID=UPI001A639D5B|nr:selenocysteine-specific translation elongation factor [Sulfuritalea sp.]MBL8478780.1 selenocysteine-specific translation elongation factor [Sterolibacteriaceae bacterium]MBN8473683.1 selenocysteine-specific translation elongation factor [Sulfuritalea sp.]
MLIGTAGHIDHGKTTLVKALTGVDADRLPEEKARGITLDLGYAYTALADGSVLGFVDVPGHEKLIHNMLAGATGIDFVLLVIAADDGPMPQTREHLELLDLLGLTRGAVALNKIDVVTPQRLAEAQAEVAALLAGTGLAGSPVFPLSARGGEGVPALRAHLDAVAAGTARALAQGRFRLAIDRCFSLAGAGTVVTGTAHSGKVGAGDTVIVSPPGRSGQLRARVRSLHVQDRPAQQGQAGERCALALVGDFEKRDIERGMWVVDPALAIPLRRFQGELRVPPGQAALRHLQTVHVHLGAEDIMGRVALLDCAEAGAGEAALVEILLERETLALRGDRFVLRDAGAQRSVGGGRVLDIFPPTRHKRSAERLALLAAMRDNDPLPTLSLLAARTGAGVDLARFAAAWNLAAPEAEALWARAGLTLVRDGEGRLGFAGAAWSALERRLLDVLAREHERAPDLTGVERERLRRMTSANLPRAAFDALVGELLAAGGIAQTRAWLHLPGHVASVSAGDRDLFTVLKPLLDAAPFNPPRVRDVFRASGTAEDVVRQLFRRMARGGELYPVAHDHYFTAAAVANLAAIVRRLNAERGMARAADLRDIIYGDGGGGRKVAIQILEFFDRIGYTRRVRDEHLLRGGATTHAWLDE